MFTLPLILATARSETSLGGTDWGMLQAGITIAMIPCIGIYLLAEVLRVRLHAGGTQVTEPARHARGQR